MVLLDKRPLQVRAVLNETNCAEWSAVDLIFLIRSTAPKCGRLKALCERPVVEGDQHRVSLPQTQDG
jgi:hypothetical protein